MEQVDKNKWLEVRPQIKSQLKQDQFKLLCNLHAKYFNHPYEEPCGCSPKKLVRWIKDLDELANG